MSVTRRGIYHDLTESEYVISNGEITLFFSSRVYMKKFLRDYEANRGKWRKRLVSREKEPLPINLDTLADVLLYEEIERRGFRAVVMGVEYDWERLLQYALGQGIKKHTTNWREVPGEK